MSLTIPSAARAADDDDATLAGAPRWWKGNIHTHSFWSDGDDFPEMIADWYRAQGYNFLALSDHNVLSQGQRWVKVGAVVRKAGSIAAIDRYRDRFGEAWVERRGEGETEEIRLKPLNEFRALVEERGKFIMIQGEEITQSVDKRPVHLNATNLRDFIKPPGGKTVVETMQNAVAAVEEQQKQTGQPMIVHLNHPNFQWGITAEELAQVHSERFFEIYNGHPGVRQLGDESHESLERIWDIVNTLRMTQLHARPILGVGVDDSHHYHTLGMNRSGPGRGWIFVRAAYLTPESIINAMNVADFYASSGVTLKDVQFKDGRITLEIDPVPGESYTTRFVGTPVQHQLMSDGRYSSQVGMTFAEVPGTSPSYTLTDKELYVRAIVFSDAKPVHPVWKEQVKQAWTQPVTLQPQPVPASPAPAPSTP